MRGVSIATLLFTDIQGSTALLQRVGPHYADLLERHRVIIREAITANAGVEQDTAGDSFFVSFDSPSAAIAAAVAAQRALLAEPWPIDAAVSVRMGIHLGEVAHTMGGLVGLAVHHAARVGAAAHGGQIVVTEAAKASAASMPEGVALRALGSHRVRDVGLIAMYQVTSPDLPREFPALRTQGGAANNLPAPMTTLVGRRAESAAVVDLLARHRLVTLTGAGGSGKTRLALQVASTLGDRFPDGIWLAELAAITDGDDLIGAIGEAIGIRGSADSVMAGLREVEMLIIFDNCEHLLDASGALIARVLRANSKLTVLTTSREPVGLAGEAVFRIPSLSVPALGATADDVQTTESAQLFMERARLVQTEFPPDHFEIAAIGEICRRLDGVPLAIELAAARTRHLTPTDIAVRLDDRFRLLTGGSRAALPRQQTLLATVDWSFRLLTTAEQKVLTRFAVFQGGADLSAAEHVCSDDAIDQADFIDLLAGLHDKSLLGRVEGPTARFRLPETIRQYVTQKLLDSDEPVALRDRHAEYFAHLVDLLVTSVAPRAISRLRALCEFDGENLSNAATWLVGRDPVRALRLLNRLSDVSLFWHGMEWVAILTHRTLESARDAPHGERAVAHINTSQSALFNYIDDDAEPHCDEALRLLELSDDPRACARVLAVVAFQQANVFGDPLDAELAARSLAAADLTGEPTTRYVTRLVLSYAASFEIGLALINGMIELANELDEATFAAVARLDLASCLGFSGDSEQALTLARSIGASVSADDLAGDGTSLQNGLFAALLEGEHGDLDTGLQLAEDLCQRVVSRPHDPFDAAMAQSVVARLRLLAGDTAGASLAAHGAIGRFNAENGGFLERMARVTMAALCRGEGRHADAAEVLAEHIRTGLGGSTDWWLRTLEEGAQIAFGDGRIESAATLLATASQLRGEWGKPLSPRCHDELVTLTAALADVPAVAVEADAATELVRSLRAR